MELLNSKIKHIRFGVGTITQTIGSRITVTFPGDIVKEFVYPTAFEKFIQAEDPGVQASILADISSAKQAQEEEAAHKPAPEQLSSSESAASKKRTPKPLNEMLRQITTQKCWLGSPYSPISRWKISSAFAFPALDAALIR